MMKSSDDSSLTSREESTHDATPDDGHYEYISAGIREREGSVPPWLILVMVGLLVWGLYYMLAYWSPPG